MHIELDGFLAIPQSHLFGGNIASSASTAVTEQDVLDWVNNDKRRMLHVVYRVGNLDKTIKYAYLFPSFTYMHCSYF